MSVIQIRPAIREGARLVIGLNGVSGSGKTVTAIHFAYGLANYDASKVGFLDTENRRGSLNADVLRDATKPTNVPFLIGDLFAPFSPERYIDAIEAFEKTGVEVLVVDSVSHEWEGSGGCTEIADANKGMWNKAKFEHKRFMNKLLQSSMHIVVCCRAREKDKPERNQNTGKTEYTHLGLQPIQEKNFLFELTASLMMHDEGQRQTPLKVPGALQNTLGRGTGYITADDGKAVRDWVDGAKKLDAALETWRNRLQSNTEQGAAHIQSCWDQTPTKVRDALGAEFYASLQKSAKAYDKLRAEAGEDQGGQSSPQAGASSGGVSEQQRRLTERAQAGAAAAQQRTEATPQKADAQTPSPEKEAETHRPARSAPPASSAPPAQQVGASAPVTSTPVATTTTRKSRAF